MRQVSCLKDHIHPIGCNTLTPTMKILSVLEPIYFTILFSPKHTVVRKNASTVRFHGLQDPPFWVSTIHPPNGHTSYVDIVCFGAHTPHNFVLSQNTQQWGKMYLHIKGRSFLINAFSCASLGDVGFHGMQDPPFGSLQSTLLTGTHIPTCGAHTSG